MSQDVIGTLGVIVALGLVVLFCKVGLLPTDEAPLTSQPQPRPRPRPRPKPAPQPEIAEAVMVIRRIEMETQPKAPPRPRSQRARPDEAAMHEESSKRTKSRAPAKPKSQPRPAVEPEVAEAKLALQALGIPARQAEAMLRGTSGSVEDRIKQALRGPA